MVSGMVFLALAACSRKSGEAVVLEKEHIAAAEITSPTPAPASAANDEAETVRELKPGEIVVGGYVMEQGVRGTGKDPRALTSEQWLVRVQLISGGRKIDVHANREQYEKVKAGDHGPAERIRRRSAKIERNSTRYSFAARGSILFELILNERNAVWAEGKRGQIGG